MRNTIHWYDRITRRHTRYRMALLDFLLRICFRIAVRIRVGDLPAADNDYQHD
jgi:hypothetical protein